MTLKDLTQNKPVLFGLIIIVLVVIMAIFSAGDTPEPKTLTPEASIKTSGLQVTNLTEERRLRAVDYRRQIISQLPIYLEGFPTSVGITTTINITALPSDPAEQVTLEVYGPSYVNPESDPVKNPNVKAYEESYREAMRQMRDRDIDPTKLVFSYGERDYVKTNTAKWIDDLKLTP